MKFLKIEKKNCEITKLLRNKNDHQGMKGIKMLKHRKFILQNHDSSLLGKNFAGELFFQPFKIYSKTDEFYSCSKIDFQMVIKKVFHDTLKNCTRLSNF